MRPHSDRSCGLGVITMNRRGFIKALGLVPVGVALSTTVTESLSVETPVTNTKLNDIVLTWDDIHTTEEYVVMDHHLDAKAYVLGYDHTARMQQQDELTRYLKDKIDGQVFNMMTGAIT